MNVTDLKSFELKCLLIRRLVCNIISRHNFLEEISFSINTKRIEHHTENVSFIRLEENILNESNYGFC